MGETATSHTIEQTIKELRIALQDYIEATYHLSNPGLVKQRRRLLEQRGIIHQRPFIESTPRYVSAEPFAKLGLDQAVLEAYSAVSKPDGDLGIRIHDPPYQHQAAAVRLSLLEGKSLVITTGTGSGKTECFLLPILGKLAREAANSGQAFGACTAIRAMVLYPMNALVNDQLGRLRLLFGDQRIVNKFMEWSGRPARFARYTSRTLYPGVRKKEKDQHRLSAINKFYIEALKRAQDASSPEQKNAAKLVHELKSQGKWPAKSDLIRWYGEKGARWRDPKTGVFNRCVMLPEDPELLTRHEVQAAPPDILVTNYSMLEYMLMRPLERPIFDHTRDWLRDNPDQTFLLVIDEAHLYRGAAGAEVALLIRRLRMHLGIPSDRLQVICTSASFNDPEKTVAFGAQLAGKGCSDFVRVPGELLYRPGADKGSIRDAEALAAIDLKALYEPDSNETRLSHAAPFLEYQGISSEHALERSLYEALESFPPMANLINRTMSEACPIDSLSEELFQDISRDLADRATTNLIALGSLAKRNPGEPSLFPCRIHSFYRGLAGLWVCMDPQCESLAPEERGGSVGRLFGQPHDRCDCGACVLELYTCRNCGAAYGRAYTDDIECPGYLWPEAGKTFRTLLGQVDELAPLDLFLEEPVVGREMIEPAEYDLVTGRLNPKNLGPRNRRVFLRRDRTAVPESKDKAPNTKKGLFRPCAVCGQGAAFGRSSVQDHQTKGDQPFQALIAKQIEVQAPNPVQKTEFAPLRGRKVLVFSDSRQTAARLAPNLQMYSTQDALRPLIVSGYARLLKSPTLANLDLPSLEDLYFGVLLAAKQLGARLRPELRSGESFYREVRIVEKALQNGDLRNDTGLFKLWSRIKSSQSPESLLRAIVQVLTDRYYGLESLALASLVERTEHTAKIYDLPDIPNLAESAESKVALARVWLRSWLRPGFWLNQMPAAWLSRDVRTHSGKFTAVNRFLGNKEAKTIFQRNWIPELLSLLAERKTNTQFLLLGSELSLDIGGKWAYCQLCRTTQRPFPGRLTCVNCGCDAAMPIDPDQDIVFRARKHYYRASTVNSLKSPPQPPMALIAAEHTAQLNAAQNDEVFSKAEEHELLFRDVDLGSYASDRSFQAIDVLSCTTTMEVGIDIGSLSGVSLRNMPPARANYQQRSGRAGRRGNAVATVTAFGSADSHDEHYFTHPGQMIRGAGDDPTLTLNNSEIARRHVTAYLLQRYHQVKLPHIKPDEQPQLFEVLGTVADFKDQHSPLNRADLEKWLCSNQAILKNEVAAFLPTEIPSAERRKLLDTLTPGTLESIDSAIGHRGGKPSEEQQETNSPSLTEGYANDIIREIQVEEGEESPANDSASENLLDRLFYKGVLPRYAFPTDVATFYVFDRERSTPYHPAFRFSPSQGLGLALSQYAPGKEVWIANKLWTSGAIYSPVQGERYRAWQSRRLYYECQECRYSETRPYKDGVVGEVRNCEACGGAKTLGPARQWLRPPGFAHPIYIKEGTSPDDLPDRGYATRAKLTMRTPPDDSKWSRLNSSIRIYPTREYLLITNRGPRQKGYRYCKKCGRIGPTILTDSESFRSAHEKPYPDSKICQGDSEAYGLVLGTDFISDILLISISVNPPFTVKSGLLATDVALRTLSEALTQAACKRLELEATEIQAEYRPALTAQGHMGIEAEIYLYDTLPGGAGFSRHVGQLGVTVFEDALNILENCPETCDRSCYRCLRSYKNKFDHDLLDRHVGASLLRHVLYNTYSFDDVRIEKSTDILIQDLKRQRPDGLTFKRDVSISIPGANSIVAPILVSQGQQQKFVVRLHNPLTPPSYPELDKFDEDRTVPVELVDELVVRRNLPSATSEVLDRLQGS